MSDPTDPRSADSHPPPGVDQPQEDEPPDADLLLAVLHRLLLDVSTRLDHDDDLGLRARAALFAVVSLIKARRQ